MQRSVVLSVLLFCSCPLGCQSDGTVPDCPPLARDHTEQEFLDWREKAVEAGCYTAVGGQEQKPPAGGGMGGGSSGAPPPGSGGSSSGAGDGGAAGSSDQ